MRRRSRDFGRLKLLALFLFVSVFLPNVINALNSSATGSLGSFETGETGIKLCAQIDAGPEESLRFLVTNDQGFSSDIIVDKDTCKNIQTVAATYTIRHYLPQEYAIDSVSGGTVSADNMSFVATASGQYSIVYSDMYSAKGYLHSFGYTLSNQAASAVDVHFDANGGTGTMDTQRFGLNSQLALTTNAFARTDHNFTGWNTKADGSGQGYTDEQQISFATGGEITLYAQWKDMNLYRNIVSRPNNGVDADINFAAAATIADGNGNGLNILSGTENDEYPVYYFRGELNDNYVIWADKCWKVIRTTDTGGSKMIYDGEPSEIEEDGVTTKQCLATGTDTQIPIYLDTYGWKTGYIYSENYGSLSSVGYMSGAVTKEKLMWPYDTDVFIFSNKITRNGDTYTLDTSDGQFVSGTWQDTRTAAAPRYHYFCTDGASVCDSTKIGYIYGYNAYRSGQHGEGPWYFPYFNIGGYDDIEDFKAAAYQNDTDSVAKATVEAWFEDEGLAAETGEGRIFEDDLEDTIFCNDRTLVSGALKGEESSGSESVYYAARDRVGTYGADSYSPSLECANKNDSFTKTETAIGNGKLKHKVGMITADEVTLAGLSFLNETTGNFLDAGQDIWTMTPIQYSYPNDSASMLFTWKNRLSYNVANGRYISLYSTGYRPVVSLKNSINFITGTGLSTDPYIVE